MSRMVREAVPAAERLPELRRLCVDERLPQREAAARTGITPQRVSQILHAGLGPRWRELRPEPPPAPPPEPLPCSVCGRPSPVNPGRGSRRQWHRRSTCSEECRVRAVSGPPPEPLPCSVCGRPARLVKRPEKEWRRLLTCSERCRTEAAKRTRRGWALRERAPVLRMRSLRAEGRSWREAAQAEGANSEFAAAQLVRSDALRHGLPWPVPLGEPPQSDEASRRQALRERARVLRMRRMRAEGRAWAQIAEAEGSPGPEAAFRLVRSDALRHGLPWPVPQEQAARGRDRRSALRMRRMRAEGKAWTGIAKAEGISAPETALSRVRSDALRHGLPWPVPQGQAARERKRRSALRMRRMRAEGKAWAGIAQAEGFPDPKAALSRVRSDALRHGLPWPVPQGEPPQACAAAPGGTETEAAARPDGRLREP